MLLWQPSAVAGASTNGLIQVQDGKLNGIPVWVYIVVGLLAAAIALIVVGEQRSLVPEHQIKHARMPRLILNSTGEASIPM